LRWGMSSKARFVEFVCIQLVKRNLHVGYKRFV